MNIRPPRDGTPGSLSPASPLSRAPGSARSFNRVGSCGWSSQARRSGQTGPREKRRGPCSSPALAPFRVLALLFLLLPTMPTDLIAQPQELSFTRYQLDNGLTVILHEDHHLPLVSVNLWYYVGSKDEPPRRSGFAHLFEHLMFMGTEKVPYPQFDVIMERSGGSNNATTSQDRTNYFATGPSALLDTFLFLEADRMRDLGRTMTQAKLDTQRAVVRNERRQSYENRPYGKAFLEIPERIYPGGHPYHNPVIGSHEDLEAATVGDVQDFFAHFYFPRNASLVVAGDFDSGTARALIQKHFSGIASGPAANHVKDAPRPEIKGAQRATLGDDVELPLTISVWHSPALYQPGDAELDLASSILGGGKSSRLYRRLVYELALAQEVEVFQDSNYLGSSFVVQVFGRPEASLDAIEKEVDAEILKLATEGPTARELERAKNKLETSFWKNLEGLAERADRLNLYQFHFNDPASLGRDRARYAATTPDSVRRLLQETLRLDSRLVLRVVPARS